MKILLIDNFDSFTFNLSHYLEGMGADVQVLRENEYDSGNAKDFDKIVLSPGAGLPSERLGMMRCLDENIGVKPILGVCLGMQALVEKTGGKLFNQKKVKHGMQEKAQKKGESILLRGVNDLFEIGLYHSWAVDLTGTKEWEVTSVSEDGILMSIESPARHLFGVQFHPESILTKEGKTILSNFLEYKLLV